jgi:hypothetical protein
MLTKLAIGVTRMILRSNLALSVVLALSIVTPATCSRVFGDPPSDRKWKMVFDDEFNGTDADIDTNWIAQNAANSHILCSRWRENATESDGLLHLLNKKESRGSFSTAITNAGIDTVPLPR